MTSLCVRVCLWHEHEPSNQYNQNIKRCHRLSYAWIVKFAFPAYGIVALMHVPYTHTNTHKDTHTQ